jgi:hypothetical protein
MKKQVLSGLLLLLPVLGLLAQKEQKEPSGDLLSILSSDQRMVRLAVDSSICLVRQEYTLMDAKGNEYGRNSDAYFGRRYGLGVISDSGIWVGAEIGTPWVGDRNFEKFRTGDSLRPHLARTYVRRPVQGGFTELSGRPVGGGGLFCMTRPGGLAGIACVHDVRDPGGWMVLLTVKDGMDIGDTTRFGYNTFQPRLSFADSTGKGYVKNMPGDKGLVGGIYYTCVIGMGRISFNAAGILQKDEKGWYVQPLRGNGAGQGGNGAGQPGHGAGRLEENNLQHTKSTRNG